MLPLRRLVLLLLAPFLVVAATAQNAADWDRFTADNSDSAIASLGIIVADSAGGIWTGGHYAGTAHFNGSGWTHELNHDWLMAMAVDRLGRVWAFSNGVLRRRDSAGWKTMSSSNFNEVYYIAVNRSGMVWTLLEPGLVPFNLTQVTVDIFNGSKWTGTKLPITGGVTALAVDSSNTAWVGTMNDGLYRVKGAEVSHITADGGGLPSNAITVLTSGTEGEIWVGTDQGLARYRNGAWDRVTVGAAGIPLPFVRNIAVGSDGGVWVLAGDRSDPSAPELVRLDGLRRTYALPVPFPRAKIYNMTIDRGNHPWFFVSELGYVRYREGLAAAVDERGPGGVLARPNPFSDRSSIGFDLAAGGDVAIDIVDLRGEMVRRVFAGTLAAGRHTVIWDGDDASGAQAADGLYFGRLRIGGSVRSVPLMKIRQ